MVKSTIWQEASTIVPCNIEIRFDVTGLLGLDSTASGVIASSANKYQLGASSL